MTPHSSSEEPIIFDDNKLKTESRQLENQESEIINSRKQKLNKIKPKVGQGRLVGDGGKNYLLNFRQNYAASYEYKLNTMQPR